jgi:hypothetical protein
MPKIDEAFFIRSIKRETDRMTMEARDKSDKYESNRVAWGLEKKKKKEIDYDGLLNRIRKSNSKNLYDSKCSSEYQIYKFAMANQ